MKIQSLTAKLAKVNVPFQTLEGNGYNKDIQFAINGKTFFAGFIEGKENVTDFCRVIGYDNANQESQRIFFDNFNQVLRHANHA